jgi:hypothetical protein
MADILTDVALVVAITQSGGVFDRVVQQEVSGTRTAPPYGVLLTNAVSPDIGGGGNAGGYCIVGFTDPMVVQIDPKSDEPGPEAKLYLTDDTFAQIGKALSAAALGANGEGPCPLGYCMPEGPGTGSGMRYMTWQPRPPSGITLRRGSDLAITSSTVLVDFAAAPVKANRRYRLDSILNFSADAGGGIDATVNATDALDAQEGLGEVIATVPATSLANAAAISGAQRVGANGPTDGFVRLTSIFTTTADCDVSVQVSQHVSNVAATTIYGTSWLRVTEI